MERTIFSRETSVSQRGPFVLRESLARRRERFVEREGGGQGAVSVARKEKTFFGRSRGISLLYHPLSLPLSIPFLRVPRQSP